MKGSFAILLIGGGVVLLVGLFTGAIKFPLGTTGAPFNTGNGSGGGGSPGIPNKNLPSLGCGGAIPMSDPRCTGSTVGKGFSPTVNGGCPPGKMLVHVANRQDVCM